MAECLILFQSEKVYNKKKTVLRMILQSMTSVKHEIWSKLAVFFNKYKGANGQMSTSSMEAFIVEVLGEKERHERDYVMNNFFRVDLDNNGTVSFFQLGSFLFTEHCCEISLQRHHKQGRMTYGHLKKMTFAEFIYLINQAYKFLSVSISETEGRKFFESMDTDRDNLITYEQYFSILHVNACTKQLPPEIKAHNESGKQKEVPERRSKLRKYIWEQLKRLFDTHMKGRNLPLNEADLKALIASMTGDFSEADIDFLVNYLAMEKPSIIKFVPLASRFIEVAARLGLRKFMKNHLDSKKNLNKHEFTRLLKESFRFLNLGRFKDSILFKIFEKIDRNHDGWISYEQYMDWIINFLAAGPLRNGEWMAQEDDLDADSTVALEAEVDHDQRRKTMVFSDYSLAKMVRERVREIILAYIRDEHRLIGRAEIERVIRGVVKKSPEDLKYLIAGVLREDEGDKGAVTLEEFVNFMIELYYGESAIQILHIKESYTQGASRKMSRAQFKKTIELMLSYIKIQPSTRLLDTLFDEIDHGKTKYITYKEYFTFNIYYFGKSSIAAFNVFDLASSRPRLSEDQYFVWTHRHMSAYARFKTMVISQVRDRFSHYGCRSIETFETDRVRLILERVFKMQDAEVQHVYRKFFNYMVERGSVAELDEVIELIIAAYFELHLSHRQARKHFNPEKEMLIDFPQFWQFLVELCHFVAVKPVCEDLIFIFNDTDGNKDAHISWHEYADFARNIFAVSGIYNQQLSETKETSHSQGSNYESAFIEEVEGSLRGIFQKHAVAGREALNKHEIESVCKEMKTFSNRQVRFILWSLFEADLASHKPQKEVDFHEFSSFVINYIGELSLQRFQAFQSEPYKNQLLYAQFYLIIHNAFSPLVEMQDYRDTISKISRRIGKSSELTYSKYLSWMHEAFVMVPHKKMID